MRRRTGTAGRAAQLGRTAGRRLVGFARTPLLRLVAAVALTGTVSGSAIGSASFATGAGTAHLRLGWIEGLPLWACLTGLTCTAELVAVRLRHRDAVEELTLLDPMVLLTGLLLPPRQALTATVTGLAVAYAVRRRSPPKAVFNLGTYATATSVMIGLLYLASPAPPVGVDLRLVAAMLVAGAGFVTINSIAMSLLFSTLGAGAIGRLLREDLRLAGFTLVTTLALSATVTTIAVHTPAFLPFTVLPAAAITYAYRALATEEEARQRTAHVLTFSQALAANPGRDQAVAAFTRLARHGFAADEVLIGFPGEDPVAVGGPADGPEHRIPVSAAHADLLLRAGDGPSLIEQPGPQPWTTAIVAPLEADGTHLGSVAIGRTGRHPFLPQDLIALASLASALAAALSSSQHLADLLAETSKLRAVLDQSSDGILVLDGQGRVQLWNPALSRLTGRTEGDAMRQPLDGLLTAQDLDGEPLGAFSAARDRLSPATPAAVVDAELLRPDGQTRSVRWAHAATFDGDDLLRDVVNVHDLTRERQVERLKSDFVATISHELRTPITPLKGYADLLLRRGDTLPEAKRVKALELIADRADHLARLVEDLLLASNINSDQQPAQSVQLAPEDLTALAVRATEDFSESAARLRTITPDGPVMVTCDRARTIQVLTNLVSNALKYSPGQAEVEIRVGTDQDRGSVTVRDRGRGLPQDELERIFEKFHRVEDPMVMSTGGTGLGLYIARHLSRAMQGDLTVVSHLDVGSEFTLWLPLAPREPAPAS